MLTPDIKYKCPTCKDETLHKIRVQTNEAFLTCSVCTRISGVFTTKQMQEQLVQQLQLSNHKPFEDISGVPNIRVYVKHHLGNAEIAHECLLEHMRITGKAPCVGDKLMALPKGLQHKAFAVPIGVVSQVYTIN